MKIKTKSGFVCDVNPEKAKDWRFCRALAKCDSDDESEIIQGLSFVLPFFMGKEGEEKLIQHVTNKDGIAPVTEMIKEFKNILTKMGEEIKKSQPSQE